MCISPTWASSSQSAAFSYSNLPKNWNLLLMSQNITFGMSFFLPSSTFSSASFCKSKTVFSLSNKMLVAWELKNDLLGKPNNCNCLALSALIEASYSKKWATPLTPSITIFYLPIKAWCISASFSSGHWQSLNMKKNWDSGSSKHSTRNAGLSNFRVPRMSRGIKKLLFSIPVVPS